VAMKGHGSFSTSPGGFGRAAPRRMGSATPSGGLMLLLGLMQHPAQPSWGLGDTSENCPLKTALLQRSQHAPSIPCSLLHPQLFSGGRWADPSLVPSTGCSHASTSATVPASARWELTGEQKAAAAALPSRKGAEPAARVPQPSRCSSRQPACGKLLRAVRVSESGNWHFYISLKS